MIHRSFFLELLRLTAILLVILTFVILMTQSVRFLELLINSSAPLTTFLRLLLVLPPTFLPIALPICLGIAVSLFYYHKLQDNEILILRALGCKPWTIGLSALWIGFLGLLVGSFLSFYATPWAFYQIRTLRNHFIQNVSLSLLRKGTFISLIPRVTLYFQEYDPQGSLTGVILDDRRLSPKKEVTFLAEKTSVHSATENRIHLFLINGVRQEFEPESQTFSELSFKTYSFSLNLELSESSFQPQRLQEYTLPQLLADEKHRFELHSRLIKPWASLLAILAPLVYFLCGSLSLKMRLLLSLTTVFALQALSFSLFVWANHIAWLYGFHGFFLVLFGSFLAADILPYRE